MSNKILWLILAICVPIVILIAKLFGIMALIAFVVVVSLVLWVFEKMTNRDEEA